MFGADVNFPPSSTQAMLNQLLSRYLQSWSIVIMAGIATLLIVVINICVTMGNVSLFLPFNMLMPTVWY